MTQNYSFTSLFNKSAQTPVTGGNGNGTSRPKSEKMVKYYLDLCAQKKITAKNLDELSVQELSNEIEQARALPYPASDAQIEKIVALKTEISTLQGQRRKFKQEFLDKLTGGRDGSASKLIETLNEQRRQLDEIAPATEQQVETIVEWFFCPDIPFENFGIVKSIYLETLSYWGTEYSVPEELDKRPIRQVTPNEFADQIKRKMTQKQANQFIGQHRGTYYTWKKTRITAFQINKIRRIEEQMAQLGTPRSMEVAVDMYGDEVEIHNHDSRERRTVINTAYTPLDEAQLIQMSVEEATKWIDMLSAERDDEMLSNIGSPYDNTQQEFTEKVQSYDANRTRTGRATNLTDARIKEYTALNDLIFKLESVVGYGNDLLHDLIKESIVDEHDERSLEAKGKIKDLMFSTVMIAEGETQARKDVGRLYKMSEESMIATSIVEEIHQVVNIYFS